MKFYVHFRKSLFVLAVVAAIVCGQYIISATSGNNLFSNEFSPEPSSSFIVKAINGQALLDTQQIEELTLQVRTILAHNCTKCHGSNKAEGELRLDGKAFIEKGGKNGAIIIAGNPEQSELIRRIKLPRGDNDIMPATGDPLTKEEIALLEYWVKIGTPWPKEGSQSLYHIAPMAPRSPELPPITNGLVNPVDRFVNVYFNNNNITWQKSVNDRIYIRRVYLDITGMLPPPDSIDAFVKNSQVDKREMLVKNLLGRDDEYAQHWLTFWNDALRNDYSGTGYITGGRFDITKWLYSSLRSNKPFNLFVKQLISPDSTSDGFIKGITWRGTINASQRVEMQAAQNISQVFLGLNLKCASCHDSFISDWKLDDAYAFANIFSDSTLEVNRCDKPTGRMAGRRMLFKELGQLDTTANKTERLKQLADLIIQPKDGRLYRTLVNRIWAQVMGRGMIEPVDVMDNAPWSQDLLDWMASDFTANGYDIKRLLYTILTSKTYQLPSVAIQDPALITSSKFVFNGMLRRRLVAEEFSDAVSETIEPVYPDSAVVFQLLPDSNKTKIPFARASLVLNDPFLTALGRPNRETVSTSRISQANLLQALELTNGTTFNDAMKRGAIKWKEKYPDTDLMIKEIYRKTLGRLPVKSEERIAKKMLGKEPNVDDVQDFLWAMALHPEFQLIF
ncbi:MAG: PSD1 domain-containing protein [Bacteroidetes bacterium]|nr:PSD1 domain-containing protein [Bacteroidota bacterium]